MDGPPRIVIILGKTAAAVQVSGTPAEIDAMLAALGTALIRNIR